MSKIICTLLNLEVAVVIPESEACTGIIVVAPTGASAVVCSFEVQGMKIVVQQTVNVLPV